MLKIVYNNDEFFVVKIFNEKSIRKIKMYEIMKKYVFFIDFWEGIMLRRCLLINSVLINIIMFIKKIVIILFYIK